MAVKFALRLKTSSPTKSSVTFSENGLWMKGERPASVVLIHGLTGTPQEMKYLADSLNKKGYSVTCPRLANHGMPIEVLKNTRWEAWYDSVRQAFLKLDASRPVFVSGLSMGALLALLLAEEFPDRIAGVSCLSPTLFYDGWSISPWAKCFLPFMFTPLRNFLYYKEEPPYGIKNEAIRQRVDKNYQNATLENMGDVARYGYPYFPGALFYQLHCLIKHLKKKLASISVPVQLIQATQDDMTSVKNSEFIYHRINSPIKEIVLLDNSYHVITADQERDKVAQKLDEFFSRFLQPNTPQE